LIQWNVYSARPSAGLWRDGTGVELMWKQVYATLEAAFPSFHVDEWWGITDPFARMVGSVLVQNTAWTNAKKALRELEQAGMMNLDVMAVQSPERLAALIRSAGFHSAKSETLLRLAGWLASKGGIGRLLASEAPTNVLRQELLQLKGIGPETADTILAYALDRPTISGDAYTRRLALRLTGQRLSYEQVRRQIMQELSAAEELKRLHGLIVEHGKEFCQKRQPRCGRCPFREFCRFHWERDEFV
jgi:endonuclease-3 related protein